MYALFIVVEFISRIQEFNSFLADRFIPGDGADDQIDQFLDKRIDRIDCTVILVEDGLDFVVLFPLVFGFLSFLFWWHRKFCFRWQRNTANCQDAVAFR